MIYTSYYALYKTYKERMPNPVAISLSVPDRYRNDIILMPQLAPTRDMINNLKLGKWTENRYTKEYLTLLKNYGIDANWIINNLPKNENGEPECTLLCYERKGVFCHRHIISRIIMDNTKFKVKEWTCTTKSSFVEPITLFKKEGFRNRRPD